MISSCYVINFRSHFLHSESGIFRSLNIICLVNELAIVETTRRKSPTKSRKIRPESWRFCTKSRAHSASCASKARASHSHSLFHLFSPCPPYLHNSQIKNARMVILPLKCGRARLTDSESWSLCRADTFAVQPRLRCSRIRLPGPSRSPSMAPPQPHPPLCPHPALALPEPVPAPYDPRSSQLH
jgi:hypothetical protein